MGIKLALIMVLVVLCVSCNAATVTLLWDDFNGNYTGSGNGFVEEHFRVGDLFATHWMDGSHTYTLPPHTGSDKAQMFAYRKAVTNNAFVTYFETRSPTDPKAHLIDMNALMSSRGADPIDISKPVTYRIHVYGYNDALNPNDPKAYWLQRFGVQKPSGKMAQVYWTGANNYTWTTLEVTQTGLESDRYQWITFESWYPGLDNTGVDFDNYGNMIRYESFMIWENLEIDYTPLVPAVVDMVVVSDTTDSASNFHVENTTRTAGLRCYYPIPRTSLVPHKGDRVTLWGHYEDNTAEPTLHAMIVKIISSNNTMPKPIYMKLKDIGGKANSSNAQGPSNLGLLIRASGKVTYVGSGFFYIDDGTNLPYASAYNATGIKVKSSKTVTKGQYVKVTGMVSMEIGTPNMPIIRTRTTADVQ